MDPRVNTGGWVAMPAGPYAQTNNWGDFRLCPSIDTVKYYRGNELLLPLLLTAWSVLCNLAKGRAGGGETLEVRHLKAE